MSNKYETPELEKIYRQKLAAQRILKRKSAKTNMLDFIQLMKPDPENQEDPSLSAFQPTPLARLLCQVIERVNEGKEKRVCVSVGPQFGKSDVLSRNAPAWLSGNNPYRHLMLGSYNDTFAMELGGDVQAIIKNPEFGRIFPGYGLRRGSEAKDLLITEQGGKMAFVGAGGSGAGKPADIFIVDDPFKGDEDAQSGTYRDKVWTWFNATSVARCHKDSAIIIIHTRWHEDDLIGRLVDPSHPERNKKYRGIADRWTYYNLPAVIKDTALAEALGLQLEPQTDPFIVEQFGAQPMVSLWEERKSLAFLAEAQLLDRRIFVSLYMGKPTPEDGTYFKKEDLVEYHSMDELPKSLNKYAASDHAVSKKQHRDSTVLGCVGLDEDEEIWVLPDLVWEQLETNETVEAMIHQMKLHDPLLWWMENELISKSFGPFLKKRMLEENVFITIDPKTPTKEKRVRARASQGLTRLRRIHFPAFAPWWPAAKAQLLKFDYGTEDDFVDWLSWIGLGLTQEFGAARTKPKETAAKVGTIAWVKAAHMKRAKLELVKKGSFGW